MTITITLEDAREGLQQLVTEFGDSHVYSNPNPDYTGCEYVHVNSTDVPGCIVGEFLKRKGVPDQVLEELNHRGVIVHGQPELDRAGVHVEEDAIQYLFAAQDSQDGRNPWGIAVQDAENTLAHD